MLHDESTFPFVLEGLPPGTFDPSVAQRAAARRPKLPRARGRPSSPRRAPRGDGENSTRGIARRLVARRYWAVLLEPTTFAYTSKGLGKMIRPGLWKLVDVPPPSLFA